jgi:hypothetical protein
MGLAELADRLENGEGRDPALEVDVAVAMGLVGLGEAKRILHARRIAENPEDPRNFDFNGGAPNHFWAQKPMPEFTTSMDASLGLVPPGCDHMLDVISGDLDIGVHATIVRPSQNGRSIATTAIVSVKGTEDADRDKAKRRLPRLVAAASLRMIARLKDGDTAESGPGSSGGLIGRRLCLECGQDTMGETFEMDRHCTFGTECVFQESFEASRKSLASMIDRDLKDGFPPSWMRKPQQE